MEREGKKKTAQRLLSCWSEGHGKKERKGEEEGLAHLLGQAQEIKKNENDRCRNKKKKRKKTKER